MLTAVDLLIVLALAAGAFRGYQTGAIRQAAGIAGLVLAFALAVQLMQAAGALVARSLAVSETIAPLIGFVLVFLAVRIAFYGLARLVETLVSALQLSLINRIAGGAVGAFQAALLMSLIFLVLDPVGVPGPEARRQAQFYGPIAAALPDTWDYAAERWPKLKKVSEQFGREVEAQISRL